MAYDYGRPELLCIIRIMGRSPGGRKDGIYCTVGRVVLDGYITPYVGEAFSGSDLFVGYALFLGSHVRNRRGTNQMVVS